VSNEHKLPRFLLARSASLDEALAAREWRRGRRWLRNSSVPTLYVLGSILIPWLVVPGVYASVGGWSGQTVLQSQPHWLFMTLAITLVGGAMATAFGRVSQIWNTERVQQTLEGWFLSGQQPGPVVLTASVTGAALALAVSLPGALLLLVIAVVLRVPAFHVPLTLLLLVVGAALAAAAASAAFLTGAVGPAARDPAAAGGDPEDSSPPSPSQLPAPSLLAAACAVIALTFWLRMEAVAGGWQRPWEEHPERLLLAIGLLTPAPALIGLANPQWWRGSVAGRLDWPVAPEVGTLLLLALYALATLLLLRWSGLAYARLREDPEQQRRSGHAADSVGELTHTAARSYWAGFANPVWTRELRTRLRGREAIQFIFFASVALAIGGFTPLVSAAGQLGDPLATATVARNVFFWLAMTLVTLIALVAPGLTAEAIAAERTRGTLELLLATPLRRPEILRGKLLGDLSVLGLLISPSLPLFGFCYLFHGASGPQVIGVFIVLALTTLLCAMIGVTASAIHTRSMAAKWQAYLLSLVFCGLTGGPFWMMFSLASEGAGALTGSFLLLSPLFMTVYGLVLAGLWGHACDRLEYLDEALAGAGGAGG
jgi:ABC-type transport system involved in multi-copper enzyme maturation permease subunit